VKARRTVIHLVPYGAQPHAHAFVSETVALARAAARRAWLVEVVLTPAARDQPWTDDLVDIPIHYVSVESRIRGARAVAGLVARVRPAILHAHHTAFDVPSALGAAWRRETHVIWHVHGNLKPHPGLRQKLKWRLIAREVDRIICVAPHLADQVVASGAGHDKVLVFENAIDGARFPPITQAERAAARRELGLPSDAIVLLHFGWDWHVKGGDLFLEMVDLLKRRDQRVVGLTVGADPAATVAVRRRNLGRSALVRPPRADVRVLYAAADVFVACSRREGMPIAVLEALATGLPVAATRIAGHSAFPPDLPLYEVADADPAALARAVEHVLDCAESRPPAHAPVRERLRRHLDLDDWAEGLFEIYELSAGRD
jgi:glycosyltransferase involved in cell wall biosynthesis